MAMAGVGNLTPQEAARRAADWFGARVDDSTTGKIKIYPKDKTQEMVVISDRWTNGNDRRNAVSRLQRAGLDVINGQTPPDSVIRTDGRSIDKHLTQKLPIPTENREDTPVTTVEPARNGHPTPAVMPPKPIVASNQRETAETLLGMLAEAEGRIMALTERVDRLDKIEHQNRARYAAQTRLIRDMEARLLAAISKPAETEVDRAERERAELTAKAIELLESLPPAATMAAGSIAASLDMPEKGNLLGKLMATAAKEGRVTVLKVGAQKLYRAIPKEQA